MKNLEIMGPYLIALVNIIGLIVVWIKDYNKGQRINQLESLNKNIKNQTSQLSTKLTDIRKELGIGTEIGARAVIAKKYELDELRKQISSIDAIKDILKEKNELLEKKYDDLIKQFGESAELQRQIDIRKKEEQKIKIKPRFKFSHCGLINDDRNGTFNFFNHGGKAHLIEIVSDRDDLVITYQREAVIKEDDDFGFTWGSTKDLSLRPAYQFIIRFTDEIGNKYIQTIDWNSQFGVMNNEKEE